MIRTYETADTNRILEIWRKASDLAHPFLSPSFLAEAEEKIRSLYLPISETHVFAQDQKLLGFIGLLDGHIGGLFVDPDYHGHGIGRALVDYAKSQKGSLTVEVFKENSIGRRFYKAYGFRETGEYIDENTQQPLIKMTL